MAANLNTPEDFVKLNAPEETRLIPPSQFEVGKASNPWKELSHATNEIITLKRENSALKHPKCVDLHEEIKVQADVRHVTPQPVPQMAMSSYEDLINRQAAEISTLRKQLANTENIHQKQVARLESQVVIANAQHSQEVSSLRGELDIVQKRLQDEMNRQETRNQEVVSDYEKKVREMQELLTSVKQHERIGKEEMENVIQQTRAENESLKREYESSKRTYEKTIEQQKEQLDQMKTYLDQAAQSSKSSDIWKRENEALSHKIEVLQKEKEAFASSVHLLTVRLNSQNDILVLQEQQLSKVKEGSLEKKKQVLLTRWREKVYQLLVQLKSQELVHKADERNHKNLLVNIENEVDTKQKECAMLQHMLADKQAQLELQLHNNQRLQEELTVAENVALKLDDTNRQNQEVITQLQQFAVSIYEKYVECEEALEASMNNLNKYYQRIAFASGRVEMLQSQFSRREAHLKLELEEKLQQIPTKDIASDDTRDRETELHLEEELRRVTNERDQLAAQIKEDAVLLDGRIQKARLNFAEEIDQLKDRVTELHTEIDEKNNNIESLETETSRLHQELENVTTENEDLKGQFSTLSEQTERDIESGKREERGKYTEDLAVIEQKLNDARREHTKAVVSLRQLERQQIREKERMSKQLSDAEQYYQAHIDKLQHKMKQLETDRNLLMTTLRQEGLMSKYKSQRPRALSVGSDSEEESIPTYAGTGQSEGQMSTVTGEADGDVTFGEESGAKHTDISHGDSESLHTVIDDLKALSQAVLDEEDSS